MFARPMEKVKRDRWGRPYIAQGNGKEVAYSRATTIAETLDDRYNLERWKQRMVAIGLGSRHDLAALASVADPQDKEALDKIVDRATDAAKAKSGADLGTALHALTEVIDMGGTPNVPPGLASHVVEFMSVTSGLVPVAVEPFVVLDDYKIAGTPDRIYRLGDSAVHVIGDLKSGVGAVKYGANSIAMQMAIYARGVGYDPTTGKRYDLPEVNREIGLMVHVPIDAPDQARLVTLDIAAGWEAVEVALWVRDWRRRKVIVDLGEVPE